MIGTARRLAHASSKRPRQADLRRSVSTAYYALFHAMCQNCADCFVGTTGADRSAPAWRQTYRSLEHGFAKTQCESGRMVVFPQAIQDFADAFASLQIARHIADYDPHPNPKLPLTRTNVVSMVDAAEAALRAFSKAPFRDRRTFAVWVSVRERRG